MRTVFMFSGQGSQYYRMGNTLFHNNKIFSRHLLQLDETARSLLGVSVVEELYAGNRKLSDPFLSLRLTHPAIFMVEYAMYKVLQHQGIIPDMVMGSSLGEFAAAAVAGVMSETDALRLIIAQAEAIEHHCGEGRMVAVLHDQHIYNEARDIAVNSTMAASNGPAQFIVSGDAAGMDLAKKYMRTNEIIHQDLMVSYGFHSPSIDAARASCLAGLQTQTFRHPVIPFLSGSSASLMPHLPAGHFWDAIRKPILFSAALGAAESAAGSEGNMYIDLGPTGSLANLVKYNIPAGSPSKAFQIMSPFQREENKLQELKQYYEQHYTPSRTVSAPGKKGSLACIFPGQGSQRRGMGEELFDRYPHLTETASEILGYSVRRLCVTDPEKQLNLTQYTQPALYVVNALSWYKLQEEGQTPDFVAGHSLGEYNALLAAGGIDFVTGLRLVKERGALMAKMTEGGMAAVKGLSAEDINGVIRRNGLDGLDMANYNSQNQIVLSGPKSLIARSGPFFEAAGATLYFPLNVSGAFHSRYMQPAKEAFASFLQSFRFSPLAIPVVANVSAGFYSGSGKDIPSMLAEQLVKPVKWLETIHFLMEQGDVTFRETGPGDVLTKLIYAIQKGRQETILL